MMILAKVLRRAAKGKWPKANGSGFATLVAKQSTLAEFWQDLTKDKG